MRGRIGDAVKHVVLDVADVLDFHPGRRFGLWRDRAVFPLPHRTRRLPGVTRA
ncbi:MAG: hypothetical protein WKF83_05595 [Nocardioidaceae bacterium]